MFNCNNVDEWLHLAVYVPCYCRANDRCSVLFCKVLSRWALHDTQLCDMFWVAGFKNDSPEWALLHESRINAVRITGILKYIHMCTSSPATLHLLFKVFLLFYPRMEQRASPWLERAHHSAALYMPWLTMAQMSGQDDREKTTALKGKPSRQRQCLI